MTRKVDFSDIYNTVQIFTQTKRGQRKSEFDKKKNIKLVRECFSHNDKKSDPRQ